MELVDDISGEDLAIDVFCDDDNGSMSLSSRF
jgi:hypothetical protein